MSDLYLGPDVLDQIAEAMQGFNDQTCTVLRASTELDAAGAPAAESYTPVGAAVRCRLDAAGGGAERIGGPRLGEQADYVITLPRALDVDNQDRIQLGSGTVLEVIYVPKDRSNAAELEVLGQVSK